MRSAITVAALLALAAFPGRAEQTKFDAPRANGYRVDACRSWGQGCGKEAADAFCRLHSYESAAAFEIDPRIGATTPTMTIEDRKICNQPQCDGFKSITCARADGAAGKQPQTPAPLRVPPGLADAFKRRDTATPPPTPPPSSPAPAPPAPRDPPSRVPPARLDPAEFVILKPRTQTVTLGLFGKRAPAGELEDVRKVPFPLTPDLVQTGVADVDGDGLSDLLLLETENPSKPQDSQLRFFKLDADLEFVSLAITGVNVGKTYPLLTSGRLLAGRLQQALVYAPGEEAVVIGWRPAPATEVGVHYIKIRGWQPKGVLIVLDANGDGQDDILDYSETGSLDLVTLGPVELGAGGEGSTQGASRPLLTLGPKQQFGIGDFTGDGRTDLLIHDGVAATISIAQFDNAGSIRSRTPAATGWGPTSSWTRGYDYDADGRDDLFVTDASVGSVKLARFTSQGTLRDIKVLVAEGGTPDNLRFPGYFMANGRASLLTHQRAKHAINHFWFDVVGEDLVLRPGPPVRSLLDKVPEGAFVVVGNFRRDR